MISGEFTRKVDVDAEILMTPIRTLYASGDKNAHTFELSLYRNKEPLEIDGAGVIGYFIRADGYTVPVDGTASGSVAKVTLSESCYAVVGQFNLIIKVTVGSERKAVFWGNGYVTRSQTDAIIDPSQTIPSLDELLAQIAATEAAAKAANTAATNANSATKAAQTATTDANAATKAANTAAGKIDNMTVQVSGLDAGAAPTADLSLVDGHYNLSFAIPKGDKGNTGATGATPEITVKVVTGEAGTQASVAQSGTAENPVITLTIPRGDTGSIDNLAENVAIEIAKYNFGQPYNLLDNSDFVHPIAQAGVNGAHGATEYAVDRWNRTSGATVSQAADGLKIVSDKTSWTAGIQQKIEAKRFADVMTFAVHGVFPVACRLFVYIGSGTTNFGTAYFQGDAAERTLVLKLTKPDGLTGNEVVNVYISPDTERTGTAAVVRWAALYEGEYTAETLPPYVPKGYAAELAECLRYYRKIKANSETFSGYAANGMAYAFIPLQKMRIAPTATGGGKFYYTLGSAQGTTIATATAHNANTNRAIVKCAISVTGICTGVITPQGDIDISADL